MEKLKHEYLSNGWHPDYTFTIRDSRYAFRGQRFANERPSHDVLWFVGAAAFIFVFVVVLVWLKS